MGAWDNKAFDNDQACDWAHYYKTANDVHDLSYAAQAIGAVEANGAKPLSAVTACRALAACEVIARLKGNFGYKNSYTSGVDEWVSKQTIVPPATLIALASSAIDRILGKKSELRNLWYEGNKEFGDEWRATVEDLRARLLKK